jgi:diguanylate cyclase (GGDEF)-like protein
MVTLSPSRTSVATPLDASGRVAVGAADVGRGPGDALDDVLQPCSPALRFPPELEARYGHDIAPERLKRLQMGVLLVLFMSNFMLVSDWLMVHDQFDLGLRLRLWAYTPLTLACLISLRYLKPAQREWAPFYLGLLSAAIMVALCLRSTDPLAPPYLVCLVLVMLVNGGVMRMRFWMSLKVDVLLVAMFAGAVFAMPNPPFEIMVPMALVVTTTSAFTLYSSYALELEERNNWLMLQQEHRLLNELSAANTQLDALSRVDGLTGLANRRHFDEYLAKVWQRARHGGHELSVLMMDVDHFKAYNDHYGHIEGDACLQDVAAALKRQLRRPGDMVARFGGEEFIAVLSHASQDDALVVAERVRAGLIELNRPHEASTTAPCVTLSIGVACIRPSHPQASLKGLLAAADDALYQAKAAGRNRVVAFGALV